MSFEGFFNLARLLAVADYVAVGDEEVVAGEVFVCEFLFLFVELLEDADAEGH
jgi:hypothetical protein